MVAELPIEVDLEYEAGVGQVVVGGAVLLLHTATPPPSTYWYTSRTHNSINSSHGQP